MVYHTILMNIFNQYDTENTYKYFVNDLQNATNILIPIICADDTSIYYSHSNMKNLFEMTN